jgi:L-ascorbate metabolism protein UlaG (beta-lactamase superfamily)
MHARLALPHHFGTFPGTSQNADGFAAELKKTKIDFYETKPGATISFRGKQLLRP